MWGFRACLCLMLMVVARLALAQQHCPVLGYPEIIGTQYHVQCDDAGTILFVEITAEQYTAARCRGCGATIFQTYCPVDTLVIATTAGPEWATPSGQPEPCDVFIGRDVFIWNAAADFIFVVLPDGNELEIDKSVTSLVWAGQPGNSVLLGFDPPLPELTVGE